MRPYHSAEGGDSSCIRHMLRYGHRHWTYDRKWSYGEWVYVGGRGLVLLVHRNGENPSQNFFFTPIEVFFLQITQKHSFLLLMLIGDVETLVWCFPLGEVDG